MKRIGIYLLIFLWAGVQIPAQTHPDTVKTTTVSSPEAPTTSGTPVREAPGTEPPTREAPKTYTLAGISVEGSEFHNRNTVILKSGLEIGEEIQIPGPRITDAIKKLWKANLYSDLSIEIDSVRDDQIFLLISVEELPIIAYPEFEGVTKSQSNDLLEKLHLIRGTCWTEEKAIKTRRVVRNYFIEKGHYHAEVKISTEPDKFMPNGRKINIKVDKGPRIKINEILLTGNQEFRDGKLKTQLNPIKEKKWWRIWKRSKYKAEDHRIARGNLLDFYNSAGYRDAEIVFDTVYNHDESSLNLEMEIREGQQYYFRDIHWVGNYKYRDGFLDTLFGIQRGDVYDAQRLDRRLLGDPTGTDVSALYLDDGYLFFHAEPVENRIEGDSIDLEMRITEGPQATIRKIMIEGNTKTSDYVILRELRSLPGQKFSRSTLYRSQRDLLALGFFNQETLEMVPLPDPQTGTVDIKYKVQETPADKFQLQLGWSPSLEDSNGEQYGGGLVGTVSLAFNNFSTKRLFRKRAWNPVPAGDGQKLSVAAQMMGTGGQNYSVSFLDPWIGGKKPNSLGATVNYMINKNENTGFRMNTFGASLDYGWRMKWPDDFFRGYTSLNYKYYDIQNGGSIFGTGSDAEIDDGFINVLTLCQTFERSSVDAPIYPRSGSDFRFSVEATPPFSLLGRFRGQDLSEVPNQEKFNLLEYHKWTFSASWYHELVKNLVIRPKVEAGFLGSYNKEYGVSPFERFIMGGSGLGGVNFYGLDYISMRGYPNNSIGAEGGGGNIYNKYSLELRYPITLNQSVPVWMLAFAEAGNTWNGWDNYDPFDLKRSAGVGIRAVLPMIGLIGVDCGWGFDAADYGERHRGPQFNLVIGREF